MEYINRQEYPFLNQIMWDTQASYISPEEAFNLCEIRWKYIDELTLTAKEEELLKFLIAEIGKGLFLHA